MVNLLCSRVFLSFYKLIVTLLLIFLLVICCKENAMSIEKVGLTSFQGISEDSWQKLSEKKIFFGHQSIGNNIIDGIYTAIKNYPSVKLNIVKGRDHEIFSNGVFAHDKVGKNHYFKSKMDDFYNIMHANRDTNIDLAFIKFCFVDIDVTSDVHGLFDYYRSKITILKEKFPNTVFIHFTVPLVRGEKKFRVSSIKKIIKKTVGKKTLHFLSNEHNVARNRFNSLLISAYQGKDPVFDIAEIESTKPDGQRSSFKHDGEIFYSLFQGYTNDAGHLNETGQKLVAEKLLALLADLSEKQ
jgi:hypothetical protein